MVLIVNKNAQNLLIEHSLTLCFHKPHNICALFACVLFCLGYIMVLAEFCNLLYNIVKGLSTRKIAPVSMKSPYVMLVKRNWTKDSGNGVHNSLNLLYLRYWTRLSVCLQTTWFSTVWPSAATAMTKTLYMFLHRCLMHHMPYSINGLVQNWYRYF